MLQFFMALASFLSLLKTGGSLSPDGLTVVTPPSETGGGLDPNGRA